MSSSLAGNSHCERLLTRVGRVSEVPVSVAMFHDRILLRHENDYGRRDADAQTNNSLSREVLSRDRVDHPQQQYDDWTSSAGPDPPVPRLLTTAHRTAKTPGFGSAVLDLLSTFRAAVLESLEGLECSVRFIEADSSVKTVLTPVPTPDLSLKSAMRPNRWSRRWATANSRRSLNHRPRTREPSTACGVPCREAANTLHDRGCAGRKL